MRRRACGRSRLFSGRALLWVAGLAILAHLGLFGLPASAAAGDFVFTGRGWGSGVGLSQWGAWQAAKQGLDFRAILAFYYPGTSLERLSDPNVPVTVRISSEPWLSVSSISQEYVQIDLGAVGTDLDLVCEASSGQDIKRISAGKFVNVFPKNGKVYVNTEQGEFGPYDRVEARPLRATSLASEGRVRVQLKTRAGWVPSGAREYWGIMRVVPAATAGVLELYNIVSIDKYLGSLGEVEYDWADPSSKAYAPEAVKAQAVAARTYALAQLASRSYIHDNQWDQAYLGYFARGYCFETRFPGIPQAARETSGLVLKYGGKYAVTFFSAHSGGYTTAWETGTYPYLVARPDPYSLESPPTWLDSRGPGFPWTFRISAEDLSERVRGMTDVQGRPVDIGTVTRVEILARDAADPESHVSRLRLTGTKGQAVVGAHSFRRAVGYNDIRSTLILSVVGPPTLPPGEFYDLTMYGAEIKKVVLAGLMSGYPGELFKPEDPLTRWQFAKIAVNLFNVLHPDAPIALVDVTSQPFWDVAVRSGVLGDESDWVAAALKAGLMQGVTQTSFKPYEPIKRDALATVLVRTLGLESEVQAMPVGASLFADVPPGSTHARAASYLKTLNILRGYEEPPASGIFYLRPDEPLKRMHAACVLARVLDLMASCNKE